MHVGCLREGRVGVTRHGHEFGAHTFHEWQDRDDFIGLARVRDRQQQVLSGDHAKVAMAGFGRVHEKRGRAGACDLLLGRDR